MPCMNPTFSIYFIIVRATAYILLQAVPTTIEIDQLKKDLLQVNFLSL